MGRFLTIFLVRGESEELGRIVVEPIADRRRHLLEERFGAGDQLGGRLEVDVGDIEVLRLRLSEIFRQNAGFEIATHDGVDVAFVLEGLVSKALAFKLDL